MPDSAASDIDVPSLAFRDQKEAAASAGPIAVVSRLQGGGHGVALMHEEGAAMVLLTLSVAQWRQLLPKIADCCDLAERPGELPTLKAPRKGSGGQSALRPAAGETGQRPAAGEAGAA